MHYVSIMLAFSAVIGLAIFRGFDLTPDDSVASAGLRDTAEERQIANGVMYDQIGKLNKRVLALETEIRALQSTNVTLSQTIKQLTARDGLTTASISPNARTDTSPQSTRPQNNARTDAGLGAGQRGIGLHLATFRDPATLARGWASLQKLETANLNGLSPFARPVRSASGGVLYRLIAGPLKTANEAKLRCARLKTQKRFCQVTEKIGSPLAQVLAKPGLPKLRASKP